MNTFKVDQKIRYTNGSAHVYTGIVVEVHPHSLVVLGMDRKSAQWELWNAGYGVGACIHPSQVQY